MLATKDTYIQSAYKNLQVINQDDEKRMEYEAREKILRDYNQRMLKAKERGREEGIKEGEQRGREEGRKEEKENTAKKMIAIGLPTDIIAQTTGLSNAQIESLR